MKKRFLAQSYQHFINKYCGGNKNIVLDQMKEYAECFRNNLKPNQCGMSIPKEEGIERINVVIFGLKNTTMIPYILYIAKNVQDKNELNKMYGILESYIMRRVVVHASTKSYNNLFTSLILNKVLDSQTLTLRLKGIGDATTYCPDDNEMKIGFETSKLVNLQSKGIIYLLESKIRSDNSSTALLGFNNYSLEHLMPKKWRNNWGACATEDDAKKRDSLLLTLGNLAIIPQALNASIRDAAWNVKKAGKGQNKPGLLLILSQRELLMALSFFTLPPPTFQLIMANHFLKQDPPVFNNIVFPTNVLSSGFYLAGDSPNPFFYLCRGLSIH